MTIINGCYESQLVYPHYSIAMSAEYRSFTDYDDVSIWVKNSPEGRETTSKRTNTLNLFNQFPFNSNLQYFEGPFPIVIVFLLLTIKVSLAAKCIHPPFTRFIYKLAMQTTASAGATQHFLLYPEVLFRRKLRTPYPTACLHLWRFYINCVINGFAVNSTIIIAKIKEIRGQLSRCIMGYVKRNTPLLFVPC